MRKRNLLLKFTDLYWCGEHIVLTPGWNRVNWSAKTWEGGTVPPTRFLRLWGVGGHCIGLAGNIVGIFFKSTYVSGIINQILRNVHKYAVQNIFYLNPIWHGVIKKKKRSSWATFTSLKKVVRVLFEIIRFWTNRKLEHFDETSGEKNPTQESQGDKSIPLMPNRVKRFRASMSL